jgi:nitroreductase
MSSRRSIVIGASGTLALVCAGLGWRVTRKPRTATRPWTFDPTPLPDIRLDALRYAILAPNPHNRQPWMIRMVGDDIVDLSVDLDKRLPETDPFDRQIMIGFGTFIELARIAAAERGVRIEMTPFPDGEPQPRVDARPIARLRFVRDPKTPRDPLFAAILLRRSNKSVYDMSRSVSPAQLARVADADGATADPKQIAVMRETILAAVRTEYATPTKHKESVDLIRIGHAEVDANPDGVDLSGPLIETGALVGAVNRESLADPSSSAYAQGRDGLNESYGSIPALVWITTPGNTRADQLEAGRRYVRANLRATALGLAMHPMSQSLQEYAEVAAQFAAIHRQCGAPDGARVQMLARIGYAAPTDPAPRRPLESHMIT